MITARFEFKTEAAKDFCPNEGQRVVEVKFESVEALIEATREFEPYLVNVTAQIGRGNKAKIVDLRNLSGL
jgi:hypothetical protein